MGNVLENKRILLGVSGGIAIYKSLSLLSMLNKRGAKTTVVMTEGAKEFVAPLAFQTMSQNAVYDDLFGGKGNFIPHIDLTRQHDVFLIAPATANVLAKIRAGIGDDLLSTTALAAHCPVLVSPAMNVYMYNNPATQENLRILKERGIEIIEPGSGWLACNEEGSGRMPEASDLLDILDTFFTKKDLLGKKIAVTCGATKERIDPVRYITNDSSGRQGIAIAKRAMKRGADVTLIRGSVSVDAPKGIREIVIEDSREMLEKTQEVFSDCDVLIMAAAPGDFRVDKQSDQKIKKTGDGTLTLHLVKNPDILKTLAQKKMNQVVIGFAAETQNVLENGREKRMAKSLDYIVINDVTKEGAGFNTDTNAVTIIGDHFEKTLPLMTKEDVADQILDLLV